MKKTIIGVTKKTYYVIAALVIIAAIAAVTFRSITPYFDARRPQIEKWASQLLDANINIESASLTWYRYEPGVTLHNVIIMDKENENPTFQVRTVKVFFSPLKSLWSRSLVYSGVMVSGAELKIDRSAKGKISVEGLAQVKPPLTGVQSKENRFNRMLAWMFSQPRIQLRNIDVSYTGKKRQKRLYTIYDLKVVNSGSDHTVSGKAVLHQDLPTELVVAAHFIGDKPTLENITGNAYVNVSGLSLKQWFKGVKWQGWHVKKGLLSAKIWLKWNEGAFASVQSIFQVIDASVYSNLTKATETLARLSGDIGWKKEGNEEIIAGEDILIDWEDRLWPATGFYLRLKRDADQNIIPLMMNIGYLDIADVYHSIIENTQYISKSWQKSINKANPRGGLEGIKVLFPGVKDEYLPKHVSLGFTKLHLEPWQGLPGMKNIAGFVEWDEKTVGLKLNTNKGVFDYDSLFVNDIRASSLTGDLLIKQGENKNWQGKLENIKIANKDLDLTLNGSVVLNAKMHPTVDVKSSFVLHHARHVTDYLPVKWFSKHLSKWLQEAFLSGDVQAGSIILKGDLTKFPFDDGSGKFIITGAVNNVDLHYAPGWPDIKNVNGKIKFSGREIIVDADRALINGINVSNAHAEIPYIGSKRSPVLTVTSKAIQTNFASGMGFVNLSPLRATIGKMFKNVRLSGPIHITLALTIPLNKPSTTKVNGQIDILNGQMQLVPWQLLIDKLSGTVSFTENSIQAPKVAGALFNKPLLLNIKTIHRKKQSNLVRAVADTTVELHNLEAWLKIPISSVAKGSAVMRTILDLAVDKPINITVKSNLVGVDLSLPDQYAKKADEPRPFSADIVIAQGKPLKVRLNYQEYLQVAMLLNKGSKQISLKAVNFHIGKGKALWPEGDGLYISGNLKKLTWDKIQQYSNMKESSHGMNLQLKSINLTISSLDIMGVNLTKTKLKLLPSGAGWDIDIKSPQITGDIKVPKELNKTTKIKATLDRVNIDALMNASQGTASFVAKNIPSIYVKAKEVEYHDMPFDRVTLRTSPAKTGLTIDELSVKSPILRLNAKGSWMQKGKNNVTSIKGDAFTPSVSDLLEDLDFDAHNFIAGKGKVDFNFSWSRPPTSLSLTSINGDAKLDIGKGRLIEVSKENNAKIDLARMLNLFSLQTIPRRLSLDFSDMFEKGYSFDYLRGDFQFKRGDIYTQNMRINGPVAKVSIGGRIGLAKQNFNLKLTVTPYVTASIPVAATLITGQPAIGVAVWAFNKLIGGQVSKAAAYTYTVRGPWKNPTWKVIKQQKKR